MLQHTLPPAPPAIVAPATVAQGDRDSFPKCRASGGGGPVVYTCPKAQTKTYAVRLERPMVHPQYGPMTDEFNTELTITAGYIPGEGGEIKRLTALVAADGWTIAALFDTDNPEEEF